MPATTTPASTHSTRRPPAVPLIAIDPYFSCWSFNDRLTDDLTRHWTGSHQPLMGLLRVDGVAHRFLGPWPASAPAMEQVALEVLPTRTIYTFRTAGERPAVELTLTFATPAFPHDLDKMSWPLTYVTFAVRSLDAKAHACAVFLNACAQFVVDTPNQQVTWGRYRIAGAEALAIGSLDQDVLGRSGDGLRIDWGYLYLVVPPGADARTCFDTDDRQRAAFVQGGDLTQSDHIDMPCPVSRGWPKPTCTIALAVPARGSAESYVILAYDDRWSIEHMRRKLPAYWRRNGAGMTELLTAAIAEYAGVHARCEAYDRALMADCARLGGADFAYLSALSFRQALSAHKLVWDDMAGVPLYFSKENYSNGCIATVDVTYPSAPMFLLLNPRLLEAMVRPVLDYALTSRWKFPYAPHDLGQYPLANGQVYGGGEKTEDHQMPVEECGNMLLLVGALAVADGDAAFANRYWGLLEKWARYLEQQGFDPAGQLCTDDFAGPMAHNVNLSIKAILALGAFSRLCAMTGRADAAVRWRAKAKAMADEWVREADDGDHFRLSFKQAGTWSQKYNLVWDRLLDLRLFPESVARTEVDFYKRQLREFGLPLDSREPYTKLDWTLWSATLTGEREDFDAIMAPTYRWLDKGPTRVPLTDWYWTTDGKQAGFQARSVVGGIFLPFLSDAAMWTKWAAMAGATPAVGVQAAIAAVKVTEKARPAARKARKAKAG
ncbi:MAG TPA: DUF4965 domain-containing protein [Planctomycetota bacterium]|nr:DUF4965 domain-containing protein [Planctomycetota bacterium]